MSDTKYFEINGWLCEYVNTGTESRPVWEVSPVTNDPEVVAAHRAARLVPVGENRG